MVRLIIKKPYIGFAGLPLREMLALRTTLG
jgi:hypothetical protein